MDKLKIDCHAVSEKGQQRVENQDHFLIADLVKAVRIQQTSLGYNGHSAVSGNSHGKVLLVADGMGTPASGRRAANLAIDETINYMVNRMQWYAFQSKESSEEELQKLNADLVEAAQYCQNRIQNEAEWNSDRRGMGTTLTFGLVDWPMLHIVHVGDSRCYRMRSPHLEQLTRDHTMAQVFEEAGRSINSENEASRLNNTLWNVVGGSTTDLTPEVYSCRLNVGDKLLFCTDGLTRELDDPSISSIMERNLSASQTCEELISTAVDRGGSDDMTCVVAHFFENQAVQTDQLQEASGEKSDSPSFIPKPAVSQPQVKMAVTQKIPDEQGLTEKRLDSEKNTGTAEHRHDPPRSNEGYRPYGDPSRRIVCPTPETEKLLNDHAVEKSAKSAVC